MRTKNEHTVVASLDANPAVASAAVRDEPEDPPPSTKPPSGITVSPLN